MTSAAIFDLDRAVLRGSPGPVTQRHLKQAGLARLAVPLEGVFQSAYDLLGEPILARSAARARSGVKAGWPVDEIAAVGEKIADELAGHVQPFVAPLLDEHRAAGRTVALVTGAGRPVIGPLARRLGFDDLIATDWAVAPDGRTYTGDLIGPRLVGAAKRAAVLGWLRSKMIDAADTWYFTGTRFDIGLLGAVGRPVAVNPDPALAAIAVFRRWPVRFLDKPPGVVKVGGRELQEWVRPLSQPRLDAFADLHFSGVNHIPPRGGAILVFNHRSYYDPMAVAYLIAASGRSGRFLGKKEVFDVPLAGTVARAMGGIRVDRGTGSDEPLEQAIEALRGGDLVGLAPQGTIPRGPAFFDPEIKGRWGAAKLAIATGVPVIPVGLWGTEKVWPRSQRVPQPRLPGQIKPVVSVKVGKPFRVTGTDPDAATQMIMKKISALLPPEAHKKVTPTAEQLARTYPPGYRGDPARETVRRPGSDT